MNRGDILKKFRYPVVILIIIILMGLVAGCSGSKEAEKKPSSSSEKDDLPSGLKSIRTELEKLIPQLEQTSQILPECSAQQSAAGEQQSEGGEEQEKSKQGSQGEKQSQSGSQQSPSSETQDIWSKIADSVKNIHQSWNEVEAVAIKEGLSTDTRDKFEKALEELTIKTDEKQMEESLFGALEVYRYYPDMVDLFKSKTPAEFYRLKYEIMLIRDESGREKWEEASAELTRLKAQWDILKKNEAIKDEDINQKAENAVTDLVYAVEIQEACLVMIKSEILMKNMDDIEQKLNNSM